MVTLTNSVDKCYYYMHTIKTPSTVERRAYSLYEAAELCGCSYHTVWRAVCRGDLRVLTGFGRMMVSEIELNRFFNSSVEHKPVRRRASV